MHNLTKIKIFRVLLWITYPFALVFIFPFVLLKRKSVNLFFFFDRYAIGGAQKIHLDILASVEDIPKIVYFTRKSPNDKLKQAFYSINNSVNKDIHFWCDNLLFRLFTVHYYAFYLNRHAHPRVLSANSTFFYDLLPFIKSHVHCTELLHNFSYGKNGMEFFGLANHKRLDNRIVYDTFTLSNIRKQYTEYKIPKEYYNRILFIEPGVEIPASIQKHFSHPVKILYAGRGGPQKRIWLLNKIIEHGILNNWPAEFHFAGPIREELSEIVRSKGIIHGEIGSKEKMQQLYKENHILILTSAYEGFPMVIKESMAEGCVPVVTALEGNKMHLRDGYNAMLIDAVENEKDVIEKGIQQLESLVRNLDLLQELSGNAYQYARDHFKKEKFFNAYRNFLVNGVEPEKRTELSVDGK